MSSNFVHLHVHTQYSLLDGACRVKDLIKKAIEYEMPAVAMTDHGNMFGAIDFYGKATAAGIKPIIGCEAYLLKSATRFERGAKFRGDLSHLVLFARNMAGYKNLLKLVSTSFIDGFYYSPRIDKDILSQHCEGLIATSACLKGEVAGHLMDGNYYAALKAADDMLQLFGRGNFYLEVMDHGIPEQKIVNEGLLKISKELNIPIVPTNDVHYLEQDQWRAHEALLCIQTQTTLTDPKRMRLSTDQFYFKSPEQMAKEFDWVPNGMMNTVELAQKCHVDLSSDKFHLPRFDPPAGITTDDYLKDLCLEGMKTRYKSMTPEVSDRLEFELNIIKKMGFVAYFLIVWDFINYAKNEGIPVGPGRGSAAGSIVSYLLGITDLDPLKYGLLFERFLNPERSGMPDIDIDFCYERRGEVIDYVTRKYGNTNVAQIITFGTLQARGAIRDVGRVMGAPYSDVDKIAKLIPQELGITLREALEKEEKLEELCENDRVAKDIIDTAIVLEGLNRHASTHAAGVVISDKPLNEYVPLFKTSDGQITTGFTMDGIAKIGLLKMDFLGLRTLTVISQAVKFIKANYDIDVDIAKIPLDDQKTYELLSRASSFGIFQLESSGMRDLLKKIRPSEFEDLISILALYRPGPMGSGMLDDFIKRKRGEVEVKYDHVKLEPILKETYGIIVYQEQVMKIPVALAGFTLTHADHLRRAMSKKIASVMDQMRIDFVKGCFTESNIDETKANKLFDLIDYFSGYGFNRSHSAAYALISYQTAYLKANYPVEFMASLLNSESGNTDKVVEYVKECKAMGITVLPPDVNHSEKYFAVKDALTIRYGLLAVKNVGSTAIDSIVKKRGLGYKSLFDICERVDLRLVNRKVVESLIKCGACDGLAGFRAQMIAILERALELGSKAQKEKECGQVSFFNMGDNVSGFNNDVENFPDIKEWEQNRILSFEKDVLGFYLSGHPLMHYLVEMKEFTSVSSKNIKNSIDGEAVKLVGIIETVKLTMTRRTQERMAIIQVEDIDGDVEVVIFPSDYYKLADYLREGEIVFLKGTISVRDDERKIIATEMLQLSEVYSSIKNIHVDLSGLDEKSLNSLRKKLESSPGQVPVYLEMNTNPHKSVQIRVGNQLHVAPNERMMNDIKKIVGKEHFSLSF